MAPFSVEGYVYKSASLGNRAFWVASYPLSGRFVCKVDDAGSVLARAEGLTRAEAESAALAAARAKLKKRARMVETLAELRSRVASLDKHLSEPPPPPEKL